MKTLEWFSFWGKLRTWLRPADEKKLRQERGMLTFLSTRISWLSHVTACSQMHLRENECGASAFICEALLNDVTRATLLKIQLKDQLRVRF